MQMRTDMSAVGGSRTRLYRMAEVVAHAPFSRQTIHNYTAMGLIRPAKRTHGGQRLYDKSVFERLEKILRLRKTRSLKDIANMMSNSSGVSALQETPPAKLYLIGEISAQLSVSRQTIHKFNVMGLIREAGWTKGGHRFYDESVFERLETIQYLRKKGHSLAEIADIVNDRRLEAPATKSHANELLRTRDLSRETGFSRQRIYRYTEIGLIRETSRTKGGQRLYSRGECERLGLISKLNADGYPLRAIRELFMEGRTPEGSSTESQPVEAMEIRK